MFLPKLEETIYPGFVVSSSTGAAADADSTPTCEVFEDATDTAILSPTVTKRTGKTGVYRVAIPCTSANTFEVDRSYTAVLSATVGGVAAKAVIAQFQVRARTVEDVYTLIGATGSGLSSLATQTSVNSANTVLGTLATSTAELTSSVNNTIDVNITHVGGLAVALFDALAQAGGSATITLASTAVATDNYYQYRGINIVGGTGSGQHRQIASYVGSTRVATVDHAWDIQPNSTSQYKIGDYETAGATTASIKADSAAIKLKTDLIPAAGPAGAQIKKNTALANFEFPMYIDGVLTPNLTVIATRCIDAGSFAACANAGAVTQVTGLGGMYRISLAASDLNGDKVTLSFAASGASTTVYTIIPEKP